MNFTLARIRSDKYGTFGLFSGASPLFTTCEPEHPIPAGHYKCAYLNHPIHGWCWEILNVPGFTGVLFHVGNTPKDTRACVCLGETFGRASGPGGNAPCILMSKVAVYGFTKLLAGETVFTLDIQDCF